MFDQIFSQIISTEIEHQKMQLAYFTAREKVGPVPALQVYQPKREPELGGLVAVYVEPGAAHLVFRDEIAPNSNLDTKYREARLQVFGRVYDVESIELVDGRVKFVNNGAGINIYETSLHYTIVEDFRSVVFTETWNHMMSAGGKWVNIIRGGYRLAAAPILEGDRTAAEAWTPEPPVEAVNE